MPLNPKHTRTALALALAFSLFQKKLETEDASEEAVSLDEDEAPEFERIRCPACRWRPRASDRWVCGDRGHPEYFYSGCWTCWNTFDTRGLCPGCGHQWRWTCCLSCHEWSLHEDWYEKDDEGGS
jgi:DNA-directed RNA polymerase subunit RPC12/RpoP